MNRLWESSCGKITLQFTKRECDSVPEFGPADDAIGKLLQSKRILQQFALVSDDRIISILQEFGAWSDDRRIVTRKTNIGRLLWIAIMDLKETVNHDNKPKNLRSRTPITGGIRKNR